MVYFLGLLLWFSWGRGSTPLYQKDPTAACWKATAHTTDEKLAIGFTGLSIRQIKFVGVCHPTLGDCEQTWEARDPSHGVWSGYCLRDDFHPIDAGW